MHPIIAKIGPFTIYSYGMMVAIAFLSGIFIAKLEAVRKKINPDIIYDFSFYLLIGSIIGARIYYILFFDLKSFLYDPVSIFKVWRGGLSIHGGIFSGAITGLIFARIHKISFWKLADMVSPAILLGQAIGRIGCFLNGCCFGIRNHPAQIYEFALDFIGFLILWRLRKKVNFAGGIFLIYLMMYSVIRITVSQFRADNFYLWGTNITLAGLTSVVIFIIAAILYIKKKYV